MINLMLDSGAYSAWTQGKTIDLDVYCDYIERNQEWIGEYVALDVINPNDPQEAAAASFQNLLHMHKRGLKPIPVFHVGESFDWLHRMLDLGCDYIGLSATSLTAHGNIDPWYASAWAHLVDGDGLPLIKAHAFGDTRQSSLRLFPWKSADSTSWMYSQIKGEVRLPNSGRVGVQNVKIDKTPGFHTSENHIWPTKRDSPIIDLLDGDNKISFDNAVRSYGIDPAMLSNHRNALATFLRTYLTVLHFKTLEIQTRAQHPVVFTHRRGFHDPIQNDAIPIDIEPFNLYFVTNATWWSLVIPVKAGVTNMLASFFYIQKAPKQYQHMSDFVHDPITCITNHENPAKLWNLLGEHIKT